MSPRGRTREVEALERGQRREVLDDANLVV